MISDNRNQGHHFCTEKMQRCQGYVEALEEERRKIQVFQRELPLCLELVTQAIEACKQQLAVQTECSEQITSDGGPVFEEFIPIKRSTSSEEEEEDDDDDVVDDDEQKSCRSEDNEKDKNFEKVSKKSDWLRSVQLWNQTPDLPTKQGSPKKVPMMELNKNGGGAFHPFKKGKVIDPTTTATKSPSPIPVAAAAAASSTGETGGGCNGGSSGGGSSNKKEEKEGQTQRKARRCWSPELHRRFLHALQHLGGSHVATPKQIRELMKVDGLTNDEVKSHLQKYRLHTRRPTPSTQNNSPQAPQYVVVGGIWVPPPEYAVAATTTLSGEASGVSMPNTIYTPIAAPAVQKPHHKKARQFHSDERPGSRGSSGGDRCSSPATSSSAHTSTASPAC